MANSNDKINEILNNLYFNIKEPVSYSGIKPITLRTKGVIHQNYVKNWLLCNDTYTLFKPVRRNFKRNRYIVININELWQTDLVDLQNLTTYNDGIRYLMTTIDVFSKRAYVKPLKNKTGKAIIDAYEKIFNESKVKPLNLQTDKGKEFVNKEVQKFFSENKINHFTTRNPDVKAAVVERFNRTLKTRMWRYLHFKNTLRYINVLKDIVSAYNNSYHRTINL